MMTATQIQISDVTSVYSGKDGKCCCGCAGKHYYASRVAAHGKALRGYEIDADEVSDRMVKKIVGLINANPELHEAEDGDGHQAIVIGERLYVAYFDNGRLAPEMIS